MDIKVIKLKIRRGTNSQRKIVVFDEGELGYTTDTQRLYVGTGYISGGVPVGARFHLPLQSITSLTGLNAEISDIVRANNIFYQLTASNAAALSSWGAISPILDSNIFSYSGIDNAISLKTNSISGIYLNNSSLSSDTINFDSFNRISIVSQGISSVHISPLTFTGGISGGGLNSVTLASEGISAIHIHPNTFSNTISSSPQSGIDISFAGIKSHHIDTNILSGGLQGGSGEPVSVKVDTSVFYVDVNKNISSNLQTIFDVLTGYDETTSFFNGDPTGLVTQEKLGLNSTIIRAISATSQGQAFVSLSSAGFITFMGQKPTDISSTRVAKRYAIPIFSW